MNHKLIVKFVVTKTGLYVTCVNLKHNKFFQKYRFGMIKKIDFIVLIGE